VKKGSSGDTVKIMQQDLMKLGYSLPKYGADGKFGSETQTAVKSFQKNSGLSVDGICGPKTWAAILQKLSGKSDSDTTSSNGLKINASILRQNWNGDGKDSLLECGTFELDSVTADGPPSTVTLKATSLPYTSTIRQTKKTRAWEKYTLSGIAKEMAKKNGMGCLFSSSNDPSYSRVEQYLTSDIDFLSTLCHAAGISLKATNNQLVLFDQATYESKGATITIKKNGGSYLKWKLSTGSADTQYTSCRVSYTTANGSLIQGTAYVDDYDEDSDSNQQLEIKANCASIAEAKTLAAYYLRLHNKYERQASFTLPGNPTIVAGMTVNLSGWGMWDGKYIVSQAKHTVNNSGYRTDVTLRKVLVTDYRTGGTSATAPTTKTYKVGDVVQFKGGSHYVSSTASKATRTNLKAGPAKITIIASGAKHPYHLIHTDSSSMVYGWVDAGTFS
jgi:phage protein D